MFSIWHQQLSQDDFSTDLLDIVSNRTEADYIAFMAAAAYSQNIIVEGDSDGYYGRDTDGKIRNQWIIEEMEMCE